MRFANPPGLYYNDDMRKKGRLIVVPSKPVASLAAQGDGGILQSNSKEPDNKEIACVHFSP